MLNYVWLALLVLGIGVALSTDLFEKSQNKYKNDVPIPVEILYDEKPEKKPSQSYNIEILLAPNVFNEIYNSSIRDTIRQSAKISYNKEEDRYSLYMEVGDDAPSLWKEMASVSGKEKDLTGYLKIKNNINGAASAAIVFEEISFAKMKDVTNAALDYAGTAVEIALGLIGIMALWLGVMKVAEDAGLINIISKALRPLTRFLFPKLPHDHPAMGAMIMNISANMLGLGNAATPFGLKAMEELEKRNPNKGVATNEMITFLAINTAGLTLIPATAIAIRAAAGSMNPAIIIGTSMFGALCATTVGITAAKVFEKFPIEGGVGAWFSENKKGFLIFFALVALITLIFTTPLGALLGSIFSFITPDLFKSAIQVVSIIAIPFLIFVFIGYGAIKKIKVYERFVEGAKEGFNIAVRIIPYLVAMLVAIGIFRAGGAMEFLIALVQPATNLIGLPAEALPMAFMRPLSGSGSLGVMAEIMATHGPDSPLGILVSTFFGSTETTFYVLAVYFGSVNVTKTRHALAAGLLADIAGIIGATFIVNLLFGL